MSQERGIHYLYKLIPNGGAGGMVITWWEGIVKDYENYTFFSRSKYLVIPHFPSSIASPLCTQVNPVKLCHK